MDIYSTNNILPATNLVNPSNSHFSNPMPQFSSTTGVVAGCNGSITSPLALKREGIYEYKYMGGKNKISNNKHIGMKITRKHNKYQSKSKRSHSKRSHSKRSHSKRSHSKRSHYKRSHSKRSIKSKRSKSKRSNNAKNKSRKMMRRGGNGYGMKKVQDGEHRLLGPSAGHANIKPYKSGGVQNPASLGAGKQVGGGLFKGYVAFTPSYSINVQSPLGASKSALASPPPIKRMNDCLNTWKHLGSEKKPYNKVWK